MPNQRTQPMCFVGDPLFHEVWATSLDAIALSDERGAVVLANPAYFGLYGYGPAQVIGHDFAIIFPAEAREAARASYRAIFDAGLPIERIESVVCRGDGSVRHVETRASFVAHGGERYMLSVIRDITERKAAQSAVAELNRTLETHVAERTLQLAATIQELLQEVSARAAVQAELQSVLRLKRAILDSASYAIIATRLDGTIVSFNPAAERLLGYRADEVLGRMSIVSFHDPDELRARTEDLGRSLGVGLDLAHGILHPVVISEQPYEAEWTYRRADGATMPVTVSLTMLRDDDGQPEGFLGIVGDISARRAAEAALHQAHADMLRAARLKDEFLANMSHELRTPLNAILGRAEVLQEQVHGDLNERQLRSVHSIEESGRDLLALINDILDIAKIEAGRIELQLDPCDVAAVSSASIRMVAEVAQQKQISLSLQLDGAVANVVADQRRLKQILVNLLSNAVKFTPAGGSIGLETHGDPGAGEVRFSVWDTGIGIAPEDQRRLFQPFVQIDSSLSRQYTGTGLGLSLVHRLVRLHGGRVELVSALGQGSRFTVILPWRQGVPASDGPAPHERGAPADPLSGGRTLVLLADDSRENTELLREYLEGYSYAVAVARSGGEALQLAGALSPAVVVMDIQMPGMNGLEAIRRLRADPATAHMPIIALTALAMVGDRERCLAAGANEYISKPVSLKQLVALIAGYAAAPAVDPAAPAGP